MVNDNLYNPLHEYLCFKSLGILNLWQHFIFFFLHRATQLQHGVIVSYFVLHLSWDSEFCQKFWIIHALTNTMLQKRNELE